MKEVDHGGSGDDEQEQQRLNQQRSGTTARVVTIQGNKEQTQDKLLKQLK